ncbi:SigE family RNA polymerase sigma factor [Nocardioides sp.]|nr:SigE family RNA polymerase sigma factor [Nocardioides sp.]
MPRDDEFAAFVREHRGRLVATARLLTGGDPHLAEDLVQTALVRVYLAWGRARAGSPAAYARRVLVNGFIDHRRRPWVRREEASSAVPDEAVVPDDAFGDDPTLVTALAELPPRMRAAVVLRHVHDLSVEETADALGCSTGTVKSQTARALDKLRVAMTPAAPTPARTLRGELP